MKLVIEFEAYDEYFVKVCHEVIANERKKDRKYGLKIGASK